MLHVLVIISYIVWICVGITIIGGMAWSLNWQRKMTKSYEGMWNFNTKDEEA